MNPPPSPDPIPPLAANQGAGEDEQWQAGPCPCGCSDRWRRVPVDHPAYPGIEHKPKPSPAPASASGTPRSDAAYLAWLKWHLAHGNAETIEERLQAMVDDPRPPSGWQTARDIETELLATAARLDETARERDELATQLNRYGTHFRQCLGEGKCTCGLDAAITTPNYREAFEATQAQLITLETQLAEAKAEAARMKLIIEGERGKTGVAVQSIEAVLGSYDWLRHGRGSYEWDDEKWYGEFDAAMHEVDMTLEKLRPIVADISDCPHTNDEVRAARAFTELQSQLAAAQRGREEAEKALQDAQGAVERCDYSGAASILFSYRKL